MPDRFVESHIRRLPLFQRLTDEQIGPISESFQALRFQPGETVFQQGQESQGLYLFVSGRGLLVQTGSDGVERQIGAVGENQYLNEGALFRPLLETATLRIAEPSVVLALARQRLMTVIAHYPDVKAALGIGAELPAAPMQRQPAAPPSPMGRPQPPAPSPTGKGIRGFVPVFEGQRENETILLNARRHWWAFAGHAWIPALLAAALIVLAALMPFPALGLTLGGLAVIFPGLLTVYLYIEWRNDRLVLTDQRAVRIEHNVLRFSSSLIEIPLSSINEVNTNRPTTDPFARVFNYGTLELRTAGRSGDIVIDHLANPDAVQEIVFRDMHVSREKRADQQRQHIRADVDKALGRDPTVAAPTAPVSNRPRASEPEGFALARMKFTDPNGRTVYRKHYIFWLSGILVPSLVVVAGAVLGVLWLVSPNLHSLGIVGPILAFFVMLLGGVWFYWADWDWRNDTYTVGDDTISIVHKRPLWLENKDDQILLSRVDNVKTEVHGLLQNVFGYGDVRVSLIGGDQSNVKVLAGVYHPHEVHEEISRRQARVRTTAQEAEDKRQRAMIGEYISAYHETVNPDAQASAQDAPESDEPPGGAPPLIDRSRPPNVPRIRRD